MPLTLPYITNGIDVRTFGAKFDGSSNDTSAIQAAIDYAYAHGGGTVNLPVGSAHITTLNLKSRVQIIGQGDATKLICDASPCVSQVSGSQVFNGAILHVRFIAGSGQSGATVLSFGSISYSELAWLAFEGFATGTLMNISCDPVSVYDEPVIGKNTIFNSFHDWQNWNGGSATGIKLKGHYGASPPTPDMVITENTFSNMTLLVSSKAIDIVNGVDTNLFSKITARINADNGIVVSQGGDATYTGQNVYVNDNKFIGLFISKTSGVSTLTFFGGDYSFATEIYGLATDIDTSVATVTVNGMAASQSHRIYGRQINGLSNNLLLGEVVSGVAWQRMLTLSPGEGGVITGATTKGYSHLTLTGSGTLNAVQVQLPANPPDNQTFTLATSALTITTLTLASGSSGPSDTIYGSPGTISPTTPISFRYILASRSWVRN